ncbi:MAG TPA: hypothetical protein VLT61_09885 [Anaeromyxobacteraceae bacterium]|nr:hypothetical protein [Anaeromyxobacteraceae bacterium]
MENAPLNADPQQLRYFVSVQAVADQVVARLGSPEGHSDDYLEAALVELRRLEATERSEHLWIFRDPAVLSLSTLVFEALEERPDGSRDWFQADTASAVAAVARFDVMSAISELAASSFVDDAEEEDVQPTQGQGKA